MRLYLELAQRSFRRYLAYRAASFAGIFTNTVFGVLLCSVYAALYRGRGGTAAVAGFTLAELITFVWIGQSLLMTIYIWGWWEVAASIQSGDVVADLMKPVDYYAYWLSRDLGRAACHVLTRGVPTFLIGVILYDLVLPGSAVVWLAFAGSVSLAVVVSFAWRFLLNVSAFWLTDIRGVGTLATVAVNFLSGLLVPIAFFPPWLGVAADVLPFRGMVMAPVDVLLGHGNPARALALQAAWAIALSLLARAVLAQAVRKLVVQGG